MSDDMDMETFVQNRLTENEKDVSASVELDPQFKVSTGDVHKRTAGLLMDSMLENVDGALNKTFRDTLSTLSPQNWSSEMVDKWQHRLEIYMEDEEDDLSPDEWKALEGSLTKFHNDVLRRFGDNAEGGLHSVPSESYALEAIEAIKLVKTIKWRVSDTFDEIYFDDTETEVERLLNKVVDKAVLLVDGGRPFERTEIDWVDPAVDRDFNKELYDFASANQSLPDAQAIPWLPPASQEAPKLLPRDILKRLTTPLKIDDVDDHEDWEYSATHPPDEEDSYAQFQGPFEQLRKNLKDLLTAEIPNYSKNLDTTSIDPMVVEVASQRLKAGEIDLDFKSMFILPYDTNSCKLVGVRDDTVGDLMTYKEVLKPPSERIMDQKLRNDPSSWLDPERPAGPRIRTFGWEPLADIKDDLPSSEKEVMKKKENPDALKTGSEMSPEDRERSEQLVQMLKEKCAKVIEEKKFTGDVIANPSIKDYLKRKGLSFGIIPEHFDTPEDFLDSLDMPILREKDASKAFPLENEVIPLEPDWLGLDGSGPHVQLTEELYWTQLQSFKKPLSVPTVDWMALLDQDVLEDEDGADSAELRRYLREATEPLKKDLEVVEPPEVQDLTKIEKDTPAKKRALDKEFVQEWIDKFGNDDGMQGLDPKNFKPPEHLVSSEEYKEKFLTHPYTSSYVFHPNFARFRRMTRNHPTYSEYTFKKLESGSTLASEDNLREFKAILSDLDKNGPQVAMDDIKPLNEKNLGVDAAEARKWEMEFSKYMAEGLSLLESYAEKSRSAFKNPKKPCKEETSEDLLFCKVEKLELPELSKEFHLQPFTLEDFDNLPEVGATNDVVCEEKPEKPEISFTSEDSDSDSDESDDEVELTRRDVSWRPFKEFNSYENVNVPQLLFGAAQLIETSTPKHFHPPPKVLEWIQGKYQPSTTKLKKWRKLYGSLFPRVDSPLRTPYLFLSEEEKLQRLRKPDTESPQPDPWALTEEERLALKNPPKKPDEGDQADDAAGDDKISRMEQKSGINLEINKNTQQWAEELNINEAPDMSVLGTPAMEFMFQLDNFQKQAIMALEKGYNVFVSAHTSAGKTVVAEYAMAMSRKRRSRAIYTSPIKALSNQKYKDFKKCFESVGLITGDVQLNDRADCLIMTTEILRSMLYNASEGIRDLEFVVLDEVHYMNDPERGHVWEEVLILLPANVQIVMLSATVPNAMEFASWVGRNKERKVKVCKTLHRPVPLKHYFNVFIEHKPPSAGQFLLRDGDGAVNIKQWEEIEGIIKSMKVPERRALMANLTEKKAKKLEKFESYGPDDNKQDRINFYLKKEKFRWTKLIEYLKEIEWLPTIVFAFSRKKCDELANLLIQTDLTTPEEKLCIRLFIKSQVAKLDEEDRHLPQVQVLRSHLVRGIGVHHSGILPVLKEIVEILFQEGKVKLLFATETFAMGVNMPARTVVFYSIIKFDGDGRRVLRPAEYTQMAGRAGRRGEDTVGNVIISYNSKDSEHISIRTLTDMMTGSPQTLKSQFRVSYRMILGTLTARSHITAENMMKQSYHENNEQNHYFKLEEALRKAKDRENQQRTVIYTRYPKDYVDKLCEIYDAIDEYLKMWNTIRIAESTTTKFLKEVQVGKLIKFRCGCIAEDVGVIMKVTTTSMEFVVLGLRDFDRNAVLERHPDVFITDRWFQFLSMFPRPKEKPSTGEVDKRLLTYTIKVGDILEIYKDSANVKEEEAPLLIRNANLSNFGGRSYGFSNETRTVVGDSIGHPENPYCMPYPTSQNMPHFGIQSTNVVSSKSNSPRTPGRTQIHQEFPDSGQNLNCASPGNVCLAADSSKSCGEDRVFKQQNTRELWRPLSCSSPSYDSDTPTFIRYNSKAAVNLHGKEYVQRSASYIPQHPLIGQPLVYLPAAPPHVSGFSYSQTNRHDFNAPNRFSNFVLDNTWGNVSLNVPTWSSPSHSVVYSTPNQPVRSVPNMNSTPYVQGVNIRGPNQATPVRSWIPFQQNQHPEIQLTNLQQPRSNPSLAVCRPPVFENEVEFPKLGSSPLSDKSAPVPHKVCSSADSVFSTSLTQESDFALNNTWCNVSLNVPTCCSPSHSVAFSTPTQPVCTVPNMNSTPYVQGVNIRGPNQATPVRSWTPFQQNQHDEIQLTNLQQPHSNPSLAVCRLPALENEVEFPKLGSNPFRDKSTPVPHKVCSSADSVVSTSLTQEGNFALDNTWCNVSLNVPTCSSPSHSVAYSTPNQPVCTVPNMNSTPYVQGVNIRGPNQVTPVRSSTPFQQNQHPEIQLTNLQQPRSNPSLAVCRPPVLENEVEFPKLGSSPMSDKSAPVSHKVCSSADSVVSTSLTPEGDFVLDNTWCNVSLNVPTCSSPSQSVPYSTPHLPVCTVPNMNTTPYVPGVNIRGPNQATPVRSWTPFQQNQHPEIKLTNLQQPRSNPSLAVCRPPALENEVEFPKLGSSPSRDKSAPVPHQVRSSADSVVSTSLTPEGNQCIKREPGNVVGSWEERFGNQESTNVTGMSHRSLLGYSRPDSVLSGFPLKLDSSLNWVMQGLDVRASQSTPSGRPNPVQFVAPHTGVPPLPSLHPQLATPQGYSVTLGGLARPHPNPQYRSQKPDSVGSTSLTQEGKCEERFGNRESTNVTETSHRSNSSPDSVFSGFPLKHGHSLNWVMQGWDVRASQSTPPGRPNPVQFVAPYPGVPTLPSLHPQLATPQGYSVTHGGLPRQHPIPQYHSQVSGNSCDFSPSNPPPSCYPNFTILPTFPRPSCPPNQLSHPQIPLNCALVYGPRNTTKSDSDLERICYQLYSRIGLKPVDEAALAKETDFELYQMMKIKEEELRGSIDEFYKERSREDFVGAFSEIFKWKETVETKNRLQHDVADKTTTLYPEYANKMSILKTMNYIVGDSVQMKGYMAARISKYELVVTEMLVKNLIEDLTPEEVAGLMSFIVYQSKAKPSQDVDEVPVPIAAGRPNLQKAIENTKAIIDEIKDEELRVLSELSEDWENLKGSFELTDIMYQWANQKSFGTVIKLAKDFQEGMLVRWIQQLVEALNEIASAARVMGDPAVPEKIQASIKSIKRGIVFSPSLYTTL